jgi:hypothetical protein
LLLHFGYRGGDAGEVLKHINIEGSAYEVCCALRFLELSGKAVVPGKGGLEVFDLDGDPFAELGVGVCRRRLFTDGMNGTG